MKKRVLSLAIAVILIVAAAPVAFAAETVSNSFFSLTNVVNKEEWDVPYVDGEVAGLAGAEYIVSEGAKLTFNEDCTLLLREFTNVSYEDGKIWFDWTEAGDGDYGTDFALDTNWQYSFLNEDTQASIIIYVVDNEIAAKFSDSDSAPAAPPAPSEKTVNPTASTVYVNDEATAFEAYTIDGNNYFKLRDLAAVLSGSEKQFEVGYNNVTKAITLTSGEAYTAVGGELAAGDGTAKTATPTVSKIYLDGEELNLTVYTINGNNFFKLRDLMQAIDVYVGYDNVTKNITLDTSKGYVVE